MQKIQVYGRTKYSMKDVDELQREVGKVILICFCDSPGAALSQTARGLGFPRLLQVLAQATLIMMEKTIGTQNKIRETTTYNDCIVFKSYF